MMSQDCALVRPGPLPDKIHDRHRERLAVIYIRQSTPQQVERHQESTRLQYALVDRAVQFGWSRDMIVSIDDDLGCSGNFRACFESVAVNSLVGHGVSREL